MGLYYKNHRISGVNFLPRLTLAEYNNLTVKPEHWIRTDSPFDYSKTDVPKLTLAQYEDLAIKPKFWIRTDAPQSYTTISATQVDVTDSVSVKDYLDDLDATQVAYDNNTSVKEKLTWKFAGSIEMYNPPSAGSTWTASESGVDFTKATEVLLVVNATITGGYGVRVTTITPLEHYNNIIGIDEDLYGTGRIYLFAKVASSNTFSIIASLNTNTYPSFNIDVFYK